MVFLKKIFLFLIFSILFVQFSYADNIDLEEVLNIIQNKNPQLQAAKLQLEQSRMDVKKTQNKWVPELSFSYRHSEDEKRKSSLPKQESGVFSINFAQTYPGIFKTTATLVDIEKLKYKKAEIEYNNQKNSILKKGINFYFGLISAKNEINIHQENLYLINELLNVTKINEEAGFGLYSDILRVESEKISIELNLIEAKNKYENLLRQFKAFLNMDEETALELDSNFKFKKADLNTCKINDGLIKELPEINLLKKDMNILKNSMKTSRQSKLPVVNFDLSATRADSVSDPAMKNQIENEYSLSVVLSQLLYDSGTTGLQYKQAKKMYEAAQINFNYQKRQKLAEILNVKNNYNESLEQVRGIKKSVEHAEENMRLVAERFKQGDAGVVELIDAQVLITSIRQRELGAYYQERIRLTDFYIKTNQIEQLWRLDDES
ncbi:MAG: TolC family protein [Candidatus Muiribacteriota bacterium]